MREMVDLQQSTHIPDGWATLLVARSLGVTSFTPEQQRAFGHALQSEAVQQELARLLGDRSIRSLLTRILLPAYVREELTDAVLLEQLRAQLARDPLNATREQELREARTLQELDDRSPALGAAARVALELLDAALVGDDTAHKLLHRIIAQPDDMRADTVQRQLKKLDRDSLRSAVVALQQALRSGPRERFNTSSNDLAFAVDTILGHHTPLLWAHLGLTIPERIERVAAAWPEMIAASGEDETWQIPLRFPIRSSGNWALTGVVARRGDGPVTLTLRPDYPGELPPLRGFVVAITPPAARSQRFAWLPKKQVAIPFTPAMGSARIELGVPDRPLSTEDPRRLRGYTIEVTPRFDASWQP
jgi:hypothetical protein